MTRKQPRKKYRRLSEREIAARRSANMGGFSAKNSYTAVKSGALDAYETLRRNLHAELWKKSLDTIRLSAITAAAVALLSGMCLAFANISGAWYQGLDNPVKGIPGYAFVVCWAISFALLGTSYVLTVRENSLRKIREAVLFALSGLLGVLWTMLLFHKHLPANALLVSAALAGLLLIIAVKTFKTKPLAVWLLAPYALWLAAVIVFGYYIAMFN